MKKSMLDGFNQMIADDYGNADNFGLIALMPGSVVYQKVTKFYIISLGECEEGGFFCQIDSHKDWSCLACEYADTIEDAYRLAAVACRMDEDKYFDVAAYDAYDLIYGGMPDEDDDEQLAEIDALLAISRDFVKPAHS